MKIRKAERRDLPGLLPMVQGLARHHDDLPRLTEESLEGDLFGPVPWFHVLVVEEEGALLGYAALLPLARLQHGERGLDLHHLYVEGHARGRGLGRALLAACEDLGRAMGCSYLIIGTHAENASAHAFYMAQDYQPIPNPARRFMRQL
ncbi:GNAT family N-acetyltransferase [Stagnihabitans tardus]|uniref:GNAT family N-acetyltransferase n=1 Tax=Stagnihabitans tardus TaxID=2699202 RepID=A0AAE4Y9D1_9RHOB|nr:GNAT family N-acetyltransferase [Stagnihabitans tardus]NBZ87512.1 GNAT family N-acetyltransferase [Stagnihabitans tardus]